MKSGHSNIFRWSVFLSFVLLTGTLTVWIRSFWKSEEMIWLYADAPSSERLCCNVSLGWNAGHLFVGEDPGVSYGASNTALVPQGLQLQLYSGPSVHHGLRDFIGSHTLDSFGIHYYEMGTRISPIKTLVISLCYPAANFSILPIVYVAAAMRRWRRNACSLCPACGYDLRSSPDRCPECGRVADPMNA